MIVFPLTGHFDALCNASTNFLTILSIFSALGREELILYLWGIISKSLKLPCFLV